MPNPSYFLPIDFDLPDEAAVTPAKSYEKAKNLHEVKHQAAFQNHHNN